MDQAPLKAAENNHPGTGGPSDYPLSKSLTLRVITYLNVFRLFISCALLIGFNSGFMVVTRNWEYVLFTAGSLVAYTLLSVVLLLVTRKERIDCHRQSQLSLLIDMLFLSTFYILFGGLESGLGVLLIFISASAAILLPLRMALFLAALATIVIIGEAFVTTAADSGQTESLISAGFYGVTNFLTAILVHLLAFWARDYRLTAERQQRHLTRLEQVNELIIRRMRGGVLAVDQDGVIRMMNESAWFLLGNPSSSDRVLQQVSPELDDALRHWRENPGSDAMPLTLNASQAQVIPKFVSLPSQHDIRVLVFLEDNDVIAQRALELSNSSLAKLSGSIAHEIRNPLAAASHAAQLLNESEEMNDADRHLVAIINKQSRRMNDIVENILQLSRREKSRPDLFELRPWLEEVAQEFAASQSGRRLQVTRELQDGETLVMFDRSQLHQVLWKLMENAVDHSASAGETPPETLEITLRMSRQDEAGYCVVSVENNGPGIPDQHIEHIFEPFYTTHRHGSGLGLYVARQLCEANQAEITVDSTPGWKTRFHVRLALAGQPEHKPDETENVAYS